MKSSKKGLPDALPRDRISANTIGHRCLHIFAESGAHSINPPTGNPQGK